jgi:acyl dehydratase
VTEQQTVPWVRDVTRDAVRHFAWGIGDNNPLWLQPEYARESPYQDLLAPPSFLYALHETTVAPGLDDRQRIYLDVDWLWFDSIRLGTELTVHAELAGTENAAEQASQIGSVEYRDANDHLVARATSRCLRPRHPRLLGPENPEAKYTEAELTAIERAVLAESRRGASPRLWQSTLPGETLGPLTKGPLSIMDIVAWCAGALGVPAEGSPVSDGGLNEEVATGPQLAAWCAQLITDWAGDEGFLHRLQVNVIEQPGLGSTTVLTGAVTHRWVENAQHMVQIQITASARDGRPAATAKAIVALPEAGQPVQLPMTAATDFQDPP